MYSERMQFFSVFKKKQFLKNIFHLTWVVEDYDA